MPRENQIDRLIRMWRELETRVETQIAVLRPVIQGSDPHSPRGREARAKMARLRQIQQMFGGSSGEVDS